MIAILFALLSYACWGTGDIFGTIASRKLGVYTVTFWSSIFSLLLFVLYMPFALSDLRYITPDIVLLTLLIGVFFLVGFLSFTEALIIDSASLVGTIVGSFGAVSILLSIIFFGERITTIQLYSIIIIFLGIFLSTFHFSDLRKGKIHLTKGILLSLVTMITFGIWGTFIKIPVDRIGWFWPNVIMFSIFPPAIYFFAKLRKTKLTTPIKNMALAPLLVGAGLLRLGELSYNIAVSKGYVAIVAPIATSYPTLFVILAFFVFKDKITKQQILGIITTLLGIVILSINTR